MPDDSPLAEADCPIIFEFPDEDKLAEEEQVMQLWQGEVEEEMEVDQPEGDTVSGRQFSAHACILADAVAGGITKPVMMPCKFHTSCQLQQQQNLLCLVPSCQLCCWLLTVVCVFCYK